MLTVISISGRKTINNSLLWKTRMIMVLIIVKFQSFCFQENPAVTGITCKKKKKEQKKLSSHKLT